jgi:AAHS family 4-hydroxybenzoate transporter-like MFS transporter
LIGDCTPHRLRATMIMATYTGAPIGGFVGGQIVALLLGHFDWPMIFVPGGVFPLILLPILALCLPESPRFLVARNNLSPRHTAPLQRLDIAPTEGGRVDLARGNAVKMLFSQGYALQTILLRIVYFCSLLNLFLFTYLDADGPDPDPHEPRAGRVCVEPEGLRRDLCSPVFRPGH